MYNVSRRQFPLEGYRGSSNRNPIGNRTNLALICPLDHPNELPKYRVILRRSKNAQIVFDIREGSIDTLVHDEKMRGNLFFLLGTARRWTTPSSHGVLDQWSSSVVARKGRGPKNRGVGSA